MIFYLISNMYPSEKGLRYGIFVKRFEEAIQEFFPVKRTVLTKKYSFLDKLFGYIGLFARIFRLYFLASKKDIIYVHFPTYVSVFLYPFIWRKIPLVINFHGSDVVDNSLIKRFLIFTLKPIASKCQRIVVPSKSYQIRICSKFKVKDDKVLVYPSGGIDGNIFQPLNKKEKIFTVGFVSNFIEQKGWSVFLEALYILKKGNTLGNHQVIMVGDGPDLNKIVKDINVKGLDVKLCKGVAQRELCKIYNSFDVFVFPTYRESLGLVGLEALTCGVPVIASAVTGPLEYVVDGYNGYVFEKENSIDLGEKILKLRNISSKELDIIKKNCIKTSQRYEKNFVNKELISMIKGIMKNSN